VGEGLILFFDQFMFWKGENNEHLGEDFPSSKTHIGKKITKKASDDIFCHSE